MFMTSYSLINTSSNIFHLKVHLSNKWNGSNLFNQLKRLKKDEIKDDLIALKHLSKIAGKPNLDAKLKHYAIHRAAR